jgi:hypothetical protein
MKLPKPPTKKQLKIMSKLVSVNARLVNVLKKHEALLKAELKHRKENKNV